ncbi:hypothetical protein [Delftia sp.]|uniref:hypothetical protein n=1 Tax=Delftia sp. TaxID=1886637 RepID=UPI00259C8196|nr:hypothetical protein [Delftia sp.]
MNSWNAEHFRVTLFAPAGIPSPKDVLPAVFGIEVENSFERNSGAESSAEGSWNDVRAEVKRSVGRLDIVIKPKATDEAPTELLPDNLEYISRLIEVVGSWINSKDYLFNRVALSGRIVRAVADRVAGYRKFAEMVEIISFRDGISDVNFQVNVPFRSVVMDGMKVNVVSNWSVVCNRTITITAANSAAVVQENYFLQCIPDISSDENRSDPLGKDLFLSYCWKCEIKFMN